MKRLRPYFFPVLLILLVFAVYANALNNGFVSDDISGIVKVAPGWTWGQIVSDPYFFFMRLTRIIQFLIYQSVGLTPWAFRLVNIICHALSVVLVYKIVFQLTNRTDSTRAASLAGPARAAGVAFLASALFAVHPLIVESVTWISGGVYAQYGMVFLLSFWLYLKSRGLEDRALRIGVEGRRLMVYLLVSYLIYTVPLLFSEKAAALFLLFFFYEWCFGNLKTRWRTLMPYFMVSCIFIFYYLTQIGVREVYIGQSTGGGDRGLYNPLIQIPVAVSSYLELIVWPKNLTLYHAELITPLSYSIRLLVFLGYIAGVVVTAIKNRKLCFWLLWFWIPLLPTLTPFKIAWIVAERYAYLSVIGIFALIAYGFDWVIREIFIFNKNRAGDAGRGAPTKGSPCGYSWEKTRGRTRLLLYFFTLFTCAILFSLSIRTIIRNRDWQNEDTLWIATSKTSPTIPYTWNNMGDVYSRHKDYKKAAEMFMRAIALDPMYADAYHNVAETKRDMGEIGDAILMYEKAIIINPKLWQSHGSLAGIYVYKKDYQKALFHIEEALKIVPDNTMLLRARDQLRKIVE